MFKEKRRHRRSHVAQPAFIVDDAGAVVGECIMLDVSASGAFLKFKGEIKVPNAFVLRLSKFDDGVRRQCVVVWHTKDQVGVRFLPD
jgi:hypothetical protein